MELCDALAFQKHVRTILRQASIPKHQFAECVLGKPSKKLWDQIKTGSVSKITTSQLQSIEHVSRDGPKLLVTYNIGTLGVRWDTTLARRAAQHAHPDAVLHVSIAEQARTLARQLNAHLFIAPRGRRHRKSRKQ